MRRARVIYTRDRAGVEVANELAGEGADVRLCHDMAFALEPQPIPEGDIAWLEEAGVPGPIVGINVSGLLYRGGYSGGNMFGLKGSYPVILERFIRWLCQEQGARVVLVSHVTGGGESDAAACAELHRKLAPECGGRLFVADPALDHRKIKYLIGKCSFFAGARMHACIAALSQGIPAAGMAYSRKFAGVFQTVDAEGLVVDLRALDEDESVAALKEAFFKREGWAARIAAKTSIARAAALGAWRRVAESSEPALSAALAPACQGD